MIALKRPAARIGSSFLIFGLINNILYVILLSAAVDLVPPTVPKSVVLFADAFPAFVAKLLAPYFIHIIPYGVRMFILAGMSVAGMIFVASTPSVPLRLCGIGLASLSSGFGEMSFLSLTHYYPGGMALVGFGAGTGAAGLVGAGAYALMTTKFGWTSTMTIYWSSVLPVLIIISYFITLPAAVGLGEYEHVAQDEDVLERRISSEEDRHGSITEAMSSPTVARLPPMLGKLSDDSILGGIKGRLVRTKKLVHPYMLPMFIVYTAEYIAISGVAPNLLFPLSESPFSQLRDFYPAYNAIYQVGVFISRSSILLFRLQNIYTPSLLQVVNLTLLSLQALFYFVPTVWIVFVVYFWTGLLGGAVYVNTYAKITDEVPLEEREFSLGAVSVADTLGIILASFVSMPLEPAVCKFQVKHGREWCTKI